MTCVRDHTEHAVSDVDFADSRQSGFYRSACGYVVAPGALSAPPGRRCVVCSAEVGRLAVPCQDRHGPSHSMLATVLRAVRTASPKHGGPGTL
jgi:hypothetical protein